MDFKRGVYVRKLENNYCVIDLETTGFSTRWDEIIEVGILKVRNCKIVDRYNSLVKPNYPINSEITELTGITNSMVMSAPQIIDIKEDILNFISDDLLVGHNTSFDLSFLVEGIQDNIHNEYVDTVQFSRKVFPESKNHKLTTLCELLHIERNTHRSIKDCEATYNLYEKIKTEICDRKLNINDMFFNSRNRGGKALVIPAEVTDESLYNPDSPFFERVCVFTGTLEKMLRKDAMQLLVNVGGIPANSITKNTHYLILGNNDYCKSIKDGKSSKHKKAELLKVKGQDIEIIDEYTFYREIHI